MSNWMKNKHREGATNMQTRKKIIFVREPNFDLKMSGQSIWKIFQNWVVLESILGCFMHEYSEMIIILIWFSQYQNKILTKCHKIFDFWKMSGFSSKIQSCWFNHGSWSPKIPKFVQHCVFLPFLPRHIWFSLSHGGGPQSPPPKKKTNKGVISDPILL